MLESQVAQNQVVTLSITSKEELSRLFKAHYSNTVIYCKYTLNLQQSDAEDIASESFTKLAKFLTSNELPHEEVTQGYFNYLAKNTYIDRFRRKKVAKTDSISSFVDSEGNEYLPLFDNGKTPDEVLENKESRRDIARAFRTIKNKNYRSAAIMYFLQDNSYKEISEALSMNINTVCSAIMRIREQLQAELG